MEGSLPTVSQISWGAGLLEGEGYFTTNGPSKRTPMVGLSMTDRDVVEKFRNLFSPCSTIYERAGEKAGWKSQFQLRIVGKRAVGLMLTFYTFMCSRRKERIKEVLKLWQAPRRNSTFNKVVNCE